MEKEQKTVILKDALHAVRRAVKSMPEASGITLDENEKRSDLKFQLDRAALEISTVNGPGMIILRCEIPGDGADESSLKALGESITDRYQQCRNTVYDGNLVLQQTIVLGKNDDPDGLDKKLFDGIMHYLTGPVKGAISQLSQEEEEEKQANMHMHDQDSEEDEDEPLFDYSRFSHEEPEGETPEEETAVQKAEDQNDKHETEEENEEMGLFNRNMGKKKEETISKQLAQGARPQKIIIDSDTVKKIQEPVQKKEEPEAKKTAPEKKDTAPVTAEKPAPAKQTADFDETLFDDDAETDEETLKRLMASLDDDIAPDSHLEDEPDNSSFSTDISDESAELFHDTSEEDVAPHIPYVQAPEVAKQMHDMYEEINRTFDIRKQQADEREATIGRFFDRVKSREEKLKQDKAAHEAEYQEKVVKLRIEKENMEAEIEQLRKKQLQEYQTKLEKLESEKALIEIEKKKAAEANERAEALQKEAEGIRELAKSEMAYCISEDDAKKLKSDLKEVQESVTEREKTIARLKAALEMNQKAIKNSKDAQELEKKVRELENNIKRLNEKEKTKNKIIDILNKKAAKWKAKEAEWKAKESEWATKEKAYKDAVDKLAKSGKETESRVSALQKENENLRAVSEASGKSDSELKRDMKECIQSLGKANALVKKLKEENEALRKKVADTADALKNAQEQAIAVTQAAPSAEDSRSIEEEAAEIKRRLSDELGISVEEQPKSEENTKNETILAGEDGAVKIVINIDSHFLFMEKQLKSPKKYSNTIIPWNKGDIKTSYTLTENSIVCKHAYSDIIKSVSMINERFESLS